MTDAPYIYVAGFGRCGTTAVMNMLYTGGHDTASRPPAFEDTRAWRESRDLDWLRAQRGHAVKWLDPMNNPLPPEFAGKVIWLDRNPREQVKSQAKMLHQIAGYPRGRKADLRRMERELVRDRHSVVARIKNTHEGLLILSFEAILEDPQAAAKKMQDFLGEDRLRSWQAAATAILPRGPRCRGDMAVEVSLMRAHDDMTRGNT